MKQMWLFAGLVAGVTLGGCGMFGGGGHCTGPAYVVPSPMPPLKIPAGLSTPADHSRYHIDGALLPKSAVAPAPGVRREAHPPGGSIAPLPSQQPPAVAPGIAGPPLSSSQSAVTSPNNGS